MIIPCINSTSFGERGGSVALVNGGNVRVGWPGAPGCTTTGVPRSARCWSACCAQTVSENKPARVLAASSPLRHAPPPITDWSLRWPLKQKDFIGANGQALRGLPYHKAPLRALGSGLRCDRKSLMRQHRHQTSPSLRKSGTACTVRVACALIFPERFCRL